MSEYYFPRLFVQDAWGQAHRPACVYSAQYDAHVAVTHIREDGSPALLRYPDESEPITGGTEEELWNRACLSDSGLDALLRLLAWQGLRGETFETVTKALLAAPRDGWASEAALSVLGMCLSLVANADGNRPWVWNHMANQLGLILDRMTEAAARAAGHDAAGWNVRREAERAKQLQDLKECVHAAYSAR